MSLLIGIAALACIVAAEFYVPSAFLRILLVFSLLFTGIIFSARFGAETGDSLTRNLVADRVYDALEILEEDIKYKDTSSVQISITQMKERLPKALLDDRDTVRLLNDLSFKRQAEQGAAANP